MFVESKSGEKFGCHKIDSYSNLALLSWSIYGFVFIRLFLLVSLPHRATVLITLGRDQKQCFFFLSVDDTGEFLHMHGTAGKNSFLSLSNLNAILFNNRTVYLLNTANQNV